MDTFKDILEFVGWSYALLLLTWTFYLAVMNIKRVRKDLHPFAKVNAYIILAVGLPLDIIFNLIVGTVLFLELPRELLFTARLKRNKQNKGYRRKLAHWFCEHMLNQFDPSPKGHC